MAAKNIDEWLVSRLDTVPELKGRVYPTAAPVGGLESPFGIYRLQKLDINRDLDGSPGVRTATFRVELFHEDNDALCALVSDCEKVLREAMGENAGVIYIYSSSADRAEEDDLDMVLDKFVKALTVVTRFWEDE